LTTPIRPPRVLQHSTRIESTGINLEIFAADRCVSRRDVRQLWVTIPVCGRSASQRGDRSSVRVHIRGEWGSSVPLHHLLGCLCFTWPTTGLSKSIETNRATPRDVHLELASRFIPAGRWPGGGADPFSFKVCRTPHPAERGLRLKVTVAFREPSWEAGVSRFGNESGADAASCWLSTFRSWDSLRKTTGR